MKPAGRKRVVMLVDDKNRDLMVAALIAYQFRQRGIDCFLEPLEAYRGALAGHRPHLIIFNHLLASHLVAYSKRLGRMGVLTAVLLNEGLCYDDDVREFAAGKHHKGAQVDYMFCWNQPLKDALDRHGFESSTHIEVVGPPRYDFYSAPWSGVFDEYQWPRSPSSDGRRPKVLVCSNFGLARYYLDKSRVAAQKLLAPWTERIESYKDWWSLVEINHRAQQRFLLFLEAMARSRKYDLVFRPHPREDLDTYRDWLAALPPEVRAEIHMDSSTNITSLILACDLEIACEDCNTTLESWIARKPTLKLAFERHPAFYSKLMAHLAPECERPEDVVAAIDRELADPAQAAYQAARQAHLDKWCASPSGLASGRIAGIIAERLARQPEPDWSQLDFTDKRRGLKLKGMQKLGKAYHYRPFTGVRSRLLGGRHKIKHYVQEKAVTPRDVAKAMRLLEARLGRGGKPPGHGMDE